MEIKTIRIEKPEPVNFILGQSHFIKTVEDVHEALVGAVPGIKFGLAFCEASGKCLVRWTGTDDAMIELARKNATAIGAGHSFILFLAEGYFPINVLNTIKASARSGPDFLRHRKSDRGVGCANRTGTRHPWRNRWLFSQRHGRHRRYCVAQRFLEKDRLQVLDQMVVSRLLGIDSETKVYDY